MGVCVALSRVSHTFKKGLPWSLQLIRTSTNTAADAATDTSKVWGCTTPMLEFFFSFCFRFLLFVAVYCEAFGQTSHRSPRGATTQRSKACRTSQTLTARSLQSSLASPPPFPLRKTKKSTYTTIVDNSGCFPPVFEVKFFFSYTNKGLGENHGRCST